MQSFQRGGFFFIFKKSYINNMIYKIHEIARKLPVTGKVFYEKVVFSNF